MVITNSDQPVTIAVGAYENQEAITFEVGVTPVSSDKLKDSNGAGDTFVGGFLAKICMLLKEKGDNKDLILTK